MLLRGWSAILLHYLAPLFEKFFRLNGAFTGFIIAARQPEFTGVIAIIFHIMLFWKTGKKLSFHAILLRG